MVTEIVALKVLAEVDTIQVASGGNNGSEGAVTLVSEGDPKAVEKAIQICRVGQGRAAHADSKGNL